MPYHNGQQAPPDINTILRALAQSHPGGVGPSSSAQATIQPATEDEDEYDPTKFMPKATTPAPGPASKSSAGGASGKVTLPSLQDPSTITTWAPALRYVTALMARDENVVPHLQKLRRSQTEHETQWWQGRQALVEVQANRGSGRKQIEAILWVDICLSRMEDANGLAEEGWEGAWTRMSKDRFVLCMACYSAKADISKSPEDDAAELKHYDAKVYRALTQMHDAMSLEFRNMGLPFFCTQPALIEEPMKATVGNPTNSQNDQSRLSQADLRRLQSRMLETLEDLSGV